MTSLRRRVQDGAPWLVAGAFLFLALALMFSMPPGASPDESAHYIRALGVGRGQVVLEGIPPKPPAPQFAVQIAWMQEQSGRVRAPEKLAPVAFECWANPFYTGTCEESNPPTSDKTVAFETYVGTYPPAAYVVPGLLMRATDDPTTALMLGRAGILVTSLFLLALAVFALYERGRPLSLLGILSSVSPMVLALGSTLTSSGVEVAGAICFVACLLRLLRPEPPPWVWLAGAFGGATLAVARDLGPVWVALGLGLVAIFSGLQQLRSAVGSGGRRAWLFLAVLGAGVAAALVWRATEAVQPDLALMRLGGLSSAEASGLLRQVVGVFGPLDTVMPNPAYAVWGALILALLATAFFSGGMRQRIALGLAIVATAGLAVLLEAVQNIYDFGVQARHILPAALFVTMIAGETIFRGPRPRWVNSPLVMPVAAAAAAGVHLIAWHTIGRRFSLEYAPPAFFLADPWWSPPGGWILWGVLAATACGALVLTFLVASENSHRAGD